MVVPAIASIAGILAGTLVFEWFIIELTGAPELSRITFDLREARACSSLGPCGVVPMSMIKAGWYPSLAAVSFWGSLVFAAVLAYQAGARMLGGFANETISKAAHGLATLVMLTSVGAGYLAGPDTQPAELMGLGVDADRGWGPLAMLAGLLAGHWALYQMREGGNDEPPVHRVDPLPVARARVPLPLVTPPSGLPNVPRPPTVPPVSRTQTPVRASPPTTPPPMRAVPEALEGKLRFAMVTGDVTVAGIDARREDGGVLVMWRDVVGLVVRRLPPELEGHAFVDIVSTAGMTLRLLPWSKLTGEPFEGDAEGRIRAFIRAVHPRCPEARLDRMTQAFLDDATRPPAQLPNVEMLAKHDQALA